MTLAAAKLCGFSAEEMFRLAVEACPTGMIMTDRSGVILMLNSEVEHLLIRSEGGVWLSGPQGFAPRSSVGGRVTDHALARVAE
jgi:hypothetical protein